MKPPYDDIVDQDLDYHYRIVLPRISDYVPLPSYALQWTSIAYLVWDDIHPDLLKPNSPGDARLAPLGWAAS